MARFTFFLNGKKIESLEDLRTNYNPQEVLESFRRQSLQQWLRVNSLSKELETVQTITSRDDDTVSKLLMECFQISDEIRKKITEKEAVQKELLSFAERKDFFQHLDNLPDPTEMMRLLQESAKQGDAAALLELGWCYEFGKNVSKDVVKAVECYKESAQKGNSGGENAYAYCLATGMGCAKDVVQAFTWWQKSADHGNRNAMANVGHCYRCGIGTEKNIAKAVEILKISALCSCAQGQYELGMCYKNGIGVEKNTTEYLSLFELSAAQGNTSAMIELGIFYESSNIGAALKLYRKAAEEGSVRAKELLGHCYEDGKGVAQDQAKAMSLYQEAADAGYKPAYISLGECYQEGKGCPRDLEKAITCFEQSNFEYYKDIIVDLTFALAVDYEMGSNGKNKDFDKALKLYTKAAKQGDKFAYYRLGCYCEDLQDFDSAESFFAKGAAAGHNASQFKMGCYFEKKQEFEKAFELFQQSAQQEFPKAMKKIGDYYRDGIGPCMKSNDLAKDFYQKAIAAGDKDAKTALDQLGQITLVFRV